MTDQGHSLERRTLLRWLGAAALVVPTALTGCASSGNRKVERYSSDIRGSDHRDGTQSVTLFGIKRTF